MWVSMRVDLALLVLSGCQALGQAEMILFCQFVLVLKPKNGSERGPGNRRKHQANLFSSGAWAVILRGMVQRRGCQMCAIR